MLDKEAAVAAVAAGQLESEPAKLSGESTVDEQNAH
jgi:hypothetical protein